MKNLLRYFALVLSIISIASFFGCNNEKETVSDEDNINVENVAEKELVLNGLNNYHDLTNVHVGNNNIIYLNHDVKYIKGGEASAKVYFKDIVGNVLNRIMCFNNGQYKFTDVEEFSFWIYNDNSYETDILFALYDTSYRVLVSKKQTITAKAWTEFVMPIDRYTMSLINPTLFSAYLVYDTKGNAEATFYLDAFKIKTTDEQLETHIKTNFDKNEILNFNNISDMVWVTPDRRNQYDEKMTIPIYDYAINAPLSETGGALQLGVNRLEQIRRSSTVIWNGSFQLTELTGFKVPSRLLDNIDFKNMSQLSIDVYHDYVQDRQFTLIITDEFGTSAESKIWIEPNKWTTLSIEDFGILDFTKIVSVEFFYAEYMTLENYNIYVDNLCYAKEI